MTNTALAETFDAQQAATFDTRRNDTRRIGGRLKLYFAVLSCLGGMVLTSGSEIESATVIAVFFAVFGYVFVDWLELFALPAIAAYAAMGLAAFYCFGKFVDFESADGNQMMAVAQLLVFVQSILMLQRKTRRILEQLGVFCLLELIVAAVFNNAIYFGLLLIPICIVGVWAMASLAALSAADGIIIDTGLDNDDSRAGFRKAEMSRCHISVSAPESARSLSQVAMRVPRIAMTTVAPAVLMVGAVFFYVIPRTTDAARGSNRNNALVGFSDELRLEQIGQMMQSDEPAMRLKMTQTSSGKRYLIDGVMYVRGRVLELYKAQVSGKRNTATWSAVNEGMLHRGETLPLEFGPRRRSDENFYDAVQVLVTCEASRSNALFSITPYYRVRNQSEIIHWPDQSTIGRRGREDWGVFPRTTYEFGTHAFRNGVQSDLTAQWPYTSLDEKRASLAVLDDSSTKRGESIRELAEEEQRLGLYRNEILQFDVNTMPTTAELAETLADSVSSDGQRASDFRIAKAMESHLATSSDFRYTLQLNAESYPGLDPIEQFLLIDKRGHCQFFASALVMMLRSQQIPSRIVVGYQTDEYNELGGHYIARQSHAHAWVEALISRDQFDRNLSVYGQPKSQAYWLRLDPTPGAGRVQTDTGGAAKIWDLAQNKWDDYVVEMDGKRQENAFLGQPGINPMHRSYERFVNQLALMLGRVREGELGGGSLAGQNLFSWPAAVLGVFVAGMAIVMLRVRKPRWLKRKSAKSAGVDVAQPNVPFYAETLALLARAGVQRSKSQTPLELASDAASRMQHPMVPSVVGPLGVLTRAFYRIRFGDLELERSIEHAPSEPDEVKRALSELSRSVDLLMIGQTPADQTK